MVILLEMGRVTFGGPEILLGGCFEGLNEDQILGWDIPTIKVLAHGHRHFLQGPVEPVDRERRAEYLASLLQQILGFVEL